MPFYLFISAVNVMFIAQLGILAEQNNLDITTTTLHNCENSEVGRVFRAVFVQPEILM